MVLVQIRGTSGSGKSTIMRELMYRLGPWESMYAAPRRKPLYYLNPKTSIVVLGHYEIACGGCDTLGSARETYEVLKESIFGKIETSVILTEGLLWSEDRKWTKILIEEDKQDVRPLFLTTTNDVCLERILKRREGKARSKPLNMQKHVVRARFIELTRLKLESWGIKCYRCSDSQAVGVVLKWIKEQANVTVSSKAKG